MDDRNTVIQARDGDGDAFGALVERYQGMVFAAALNLTGDYTESEDLTQEVFLCAFRKLRTLSNPEKFASWLYAPTRNLTIERLRRKHHVFVDVPEEVLENQARSDVESPFETYARKELSRILWEQVAELPTRSREAILLYYVEEYPTKRAADFLGISDEAFRARLHYARQKIRDAMMDKLEIELRDHRPGRDRKNAILAALPPGENRLVIHRNLQVLLETTVNVVLPEGKPEMSTTIAVP